MAQQNQVPKASFPEMSPEFQLHYTTLIDVVNSLQGYNGSVVLNDHLDLRGKRIMNVGPPEADTDALASGVAESKYAAGVLRPQLESSGASSLVSMRRLNDQNQREQNSSWLKDIPSSVPSANAIYPSLSNVGGGVQSTIPASLFTFADGSSILLQSRTDLLSLPATYTITAISCTGDVVTVSVTPAPTIVAGQAARVTGVAPNSFNGTYPLTSVVGSMLTYQLDLGSVSGSGGEVEVQGVYYYGIQKRNPMVHLFGPYTSDNAQNRLNANFDGTQIVATVVITNSGGQVSQSGGGGSPMTGSPTAGSFF